MLVKAATKAADETAAVEATAMPVKVVAVKVIAIIGRYSGGNGIGSQGCGRGHGI